MKRCLYFIFGAGIGGTVTWYCCKEHYRKIADEEIQSVIEMFHKDGSEPLNVTSPEQPVENQKRERSEQLTEYSKLLQDCAYNRGAPKDALVDNTEETSDAQPNAKGPYIISPEEFDTQENYDVIVFTYYADNVLVDEDGSPLSTDEIYWYVGEDFASHFGEYEDDSVHIRNELRQTDYEILRVIQRYGDLHESQ